MSDVGIRKSAILLLSLGEEAAVEVFKFLGPKEVQKLGAAMAAIENVNRGEIDEVLKEFQAEIENRASLGASDEYLRSVLTKALGTDRANNLLDRILQGSEANNGIEGLKWMDAISVADLIRNEHPQIVAAILVHLDYDQAADVLKHLTERQRNEVMLRVATMEGIQPTALKDLNEVLFKVLAGGDKIRKSSMGGVKTAAEMINLMGTAIEGTVIESIRNHDPELAQKIMDKMFVFENLCDLDNRSIQVILREISPESLITALKGTSQELKDKIFKNMSSRAAEMLKDDFEAKGPVKVSEVEAEQKEILKIVRRLADEGQIVLGGSGDDGFV